jgi:hypothetical protein
VKAADGRVANVLGARIAVVARLRDTPELELVAEHELAHPTLIVLETGRPARDSVVVAEPAPAAIDRAGISIRRAGGTVGAIRVIACLPIAPRAGDTFSVHGRTGEQTVLRTRRVHVFECPHDKPAKRIAHRRPAGARFVIARHGAAAAALVKSPSTVRGGGCLGTTFQDLGNVATDAVERSVAANQRGILFQLLDATVRPGLGRNAPKLGDRLHEQSGELLAAWDGIGEPALITARQIAIHPCAVRAIAKYAICAAPKSSGPPQALLLPMVFGDQPTALFDASRLQCRQGSRLVALSYPSGEIPKRPNDVLVTLKGCREGRAGCRRGQCRGCLAVANRRQSDQEQERQLGSQRTAGWARGEERVFDRRVRRHSITTFDHGHRFVSANPVSSDMTQE